MRRSMEQARRDVELSRARMADTLDQIEHQLIRKKEEIENRVDVLRPIKERVRARPWPALAVAFGVGVVLWRLRNREN